MLINKIIGLEVVAIKSNNDDIYHIFFNDGKTFLTVKDKNDCKVCEDFSVMVFLNNDVDLYTENYLLPDLKNFSPFQDFKNG